MARILRSADLMPRHPTILSDIFPYHICARSNNRDWFELPLRYVFGIYTNVLDKTIARYELQCHAFVLMSNHFHMIASTPRSNLDSCMRFFMTESSRAIARSSNRINHVYGSRYRKTVITSAEHYAHALLYVYRNPLKAKMVELAQDHPYSTINPFYRKMNRLIVPKHGGFEELIPTDEREKLEWINQVEDLAYSTQVRRALHKNTFAFGQDRTTGKRPAFLDKLHPKK